MPEKERKFADWRALLLEAWDMDRPQEALRYAEHAERCAVTDIEKAQGWTGLAAALSWLERMDQAIPLDDRVVETYGDHLEAGVAEQVARALVNKGWCLGKQGHYDAAILVYEEVPRRYGDRTEAGIAEQVATALVGKGWCLWARPQGDWDGAILVYEEVARRYGDRTEAGIAEQVATALAEKREIEGYKSAWGTG